MNVRELLAKIGFEVDHEPLEKLEHTLEGIKERLEIFAGLEIAEKLFEISEKFAEWGEELNTTALNLGMNVEELQEFGAAANSAGVSQEAMTQGLSVLSRKLYEVRMGSKEAGDAFYKVGISSDQVKGFHTAKDALMAVADKLAAMSDPIERTAVAQELLGRGGQRMVAFLSKGSHAINEETEAVRKLGLTLSGGQVQALVEVGEAFTRVHMILHAIGATIAATVAPGFTFLVEKFTELYAENRNLINVNIHNWLMNVLYSMGFVAGVVVGLTKRMIEFAKSIGIGNDILKFVFMIGGAGAALGSLGIAFGVLSGVFATIAPFLGFAAVLAGLAVVVHDLWAVFNDSPTWSGSFLDSISEHMGGITDFFKSIKEAVGGVNFDEMWTTLQPKAKSLFKNMFSAENMAGIGDALKSVLDTALVVSGFALELGLTIAMAIAAGLEAVIRKKFPSMANMLFGEETPEDTKGKAKPSDNPNVRLMQAFHGETGENPARVLMETIGQAVGQTTADFGGMVGDMMDAAVTMATTPGAGATAALYMAGAKPAGGGGNNTTHVTVNVPSGVSDPKGVAEHVGKAMDEHHAKNLRDADADVSGQVDH